VESVDLSTVVSTVNAQNVRRALDSDERQYISVKEFIDLSVENGLDEVCEFRLACLFDSLQLRTSCFATSTHSESCCILKTATV
jgi:hypothetical protein